MLHLSQMLFFWRGKIILTTFWTFKALNWTLPYLIFVDLIFQFPLTNIILFASDKIIQLWELRHIKQ